MPTDTVITVENLSKVYRIYHQAHPGQMGRYKKFSDEIVNWAKKPLGHLMKIGRTDQPEAAPAFEDFQALKRVSFEVKKGEIIGVIGRNGAGKSTLLKVLSRITDPTEGRVTIDGRVSSLLEVGTGFHPELTGRENIFLNGAILGMTRQEISGKFDAIVDFAEVSKFLDTSVKHYSSGMYVRLAFAVAAHLDPEILIVDEVLAVGDIGFQKKCLARMNDASRNEGRTIFLVSHNLESILRLCSRVLWLSEGQLQMNDAPDVVTQAYTRNRHDTHKTVSFSSFKRSEWSRLNVEFLTVQFGGSGDQAWVFADGEDLAMQCPFRVHRPVEQLILSYSIFSSSGFEIASTHSPLKFPSDIRPGNYGLRFSLPGFRLAPGSYTLALKLRSEFGEEDHVPQAVSFDIAKTDRSAQDFTDIIRAATIPRLDVSLTPNPPS
jgi:lipopolysaccharide transport system ATP-binding protein